MSKGRYGIHGGQYISETLMNELIHLEECYEHYKKDPEFNAELNKLLNEYAGRPSLLYYAGKMTKDLGGAKSRNFIPLGLFKSNLMAIFSLSTFKINSLQIGRASCRERV